jgi:signal transduction histidine kinase
VHACEEDSVVFTDADKARQILVNLISNAFKHTTSGTSVEVYQEPPKGRGDRFVRIGVRDDGHGIAPEKLEVIFEPFVQVERALNHPVDGLGLGLAIARDLARGMGGDLTADSAPGAGATFTLSLPRG